MTRMLGALITAILVLCGLASSVQAAVSVPAGAAAIYTYDAPIYDAPGDDSVQERGPPTAPRPEVSSTRLTTTYAYPATLVQVARPTTTTGSQVRAAHGDLSSLRQSGVAANAGVARTSQTVDSIAQRAGIGLDGVKVHILDPVADADTIRYLDVQGAIARTDELGIQLHPNAFADEETLVRTLAHERTHVYQIRTFSDYGTGHVGDFEDGAYAIEDSFWQYFLSGGSR